MSNDIISIETERPLGATLYIGDIDKTVTEKDLSIHFQHIGEVGSVTICKDQTGQALGFGFVNFLDRRHAEKAIHEMNFTLLNGKPISISFSFSDPSYKRNDAANVFAKNLHKKIENKELHDMFSKYGEIVSSKVEKDASGESKGFAYVQFSNEESAKKAMLELNGRFLYGLELYVGPFVSKQERQMMINKNKFTNVFVKNLSDLTNEDDLRKVFGEFGFIKSLAVMRDEAGRSKCFGFVAFSTSHEASAAISEMHGKMVGQKPLYVSIAEKKEERQARFQSIFSSKLPHTPAPIFAPCVPLFPPTSPVLDFYGQTSSAMLPLTVMQRGNAFNLPYEYGMSSGNNQGVMGGSTRVLAGEGSSQLHEREKYESMSIGDLVSALANASSVNQKQMLGEKLFPLVKDIEREMASKVTGMLLEMDVAEVIHLLDSPNSLRAKVVEAVSILEGRDY